MLQVAFKEWSAICRALAEGRQSIILRKGGIAEQAGVFRPEHDRFWLYPTHFHEQQQQGLKPEAADLLETEPAEPGIIRLTHFLEVSFVRFVSNLDAALGLDAFHVWTKDTVSQRFHYRTPGLYVLAVRVFRVGTPAIIPVHPAYSGCKTWVELAVPVEEMAAEPVLPDVTWQELRAKLERMLA